MAEFKYFKGLVIPLEGDKLVNIPGDKGGLTKFGISQRSYPGVDIANLTLGGACDIYEKDFWNFYNLSKINSQPIANKMMSFLMNMNPYAAVQCLQRAVNVCGHTILKDGVLGSKTMAAVNQSPSAWLLDRLKIEGSLWYLLKVAGDKSQEKFLQGWVNRALA